MKLLILFLAALLANEVLPRPHIPSTNKIDECTPLIGDEGKCSDYWAGGKPPVLIISLDGFRPDYLDRTKNSSDIFELAAPFLNRLISCGLSAKQGMTPVFPSLTFPNHYSIVTGLYPESHGIVANSFYDPDLNASFSLSSPQQTNPVWWIGDPLWYTAKLQGKISATYFWPGSDMSDAEREPNYWFAWGNNVICGANIYFRKFHIDSSIPYRDRMQQIFDWLILPVEQRPNFITLYLDEPDHTAHSDSPDAETVADQIRRVDTEVEFLFSQMMLSEIVGCVDVIILSDHGMAPSPPGEKFLVMKDYVDDIVQTSKIYDGVFPTIRPNLDTQDEEIRIAGGLQCKDPNMRVYNKWDFPKRHHYASTNRIPNILIDMTVSWRAYDDAEWILPGNHGWDNLNSEMQATFVAIGPSFKQKTQVRPFHNIDLYNLLCVMIGVNPEPNNGTWGALHHMLSNPPPFPNDQTEEKLPEKFFPSDTATYEENLKREKCSLITVANTLDIDASLNLTANQIESSHTLHLPWGQPQLIETHTFTVTSSNYVSALNLENGIHSWTSYTLSEPSQYSANEALWRLDPRLTQTDKSICNRYPSGITNGFQTIPLFNFGEPDTLSDVSVDTNAIEVSESFLSYWKDLQFMISNYTQTNRKINAIIGPVQNSLSPSIFLVLSACNNQSVELHECHISDFDLQSFLLPINLRYTRDCLDTNVFLKSHVATLRDVESLTGLKFFPQLSAIDKTDLLSRTPLSTTLIINPNPNRSVF